MVRELIQQVGIEGCGGGSGGVIALVVATAEGHVDVMSILVDAGVVDTGEALSMAAGYGWEASVKFLLQQRRRWWPTSDGGVGYVNSCDPPGATALFRSIHVLCDEEGVPGLISPKAVRLLIDAGANTASAARVITSGGDVLFNGTPLALTNRDLREKRVRSSNTSSEEQLHRLEAVRPCCCGWKQRMPYLGCGSGSPSRSAVLQKCQPGRPGRLRRVALR